MWYQQDFFKLDIPVSLKLKKREKKKKRKANNGHLGLHRIKQDMLH